MSSKYILLLNGLLLGSTYTLSAQQVSDPATNIPAAVTAPTPVSSYPGLYNFASTLKKNYVRTWIPDAPTTVQNNNIKHRQVTDFVDGLGRPLQTVQKRAHADGNDLVQYHIYDAAGREAIQYLPNAKQEVSSGGQIDYSPKARVETFYPLAQGELPYSKTEFDNSPLNRVTKQLAPGKSWVGSNRGTSMQYSTNTSPQYMSGTINNPIPTIIVNGSFPRFFVNTGNNTVKYRENYANGTLYITTVTDEDGHVSEEIKDKLGRVVIKRTLAKQLINSLYPAGAPAAMFPANYLYTFYVYDDLGRLRFVLPPSSCSFTIDQVPGNPNIYPPISNYNHNWTVPSEEQLAELCYSYVYDARGRVTEKKIPGKAVEYIVYDKRDRPVLSQDGNLRAREQWFMTIYDALNRPTITALWNTSDTRADLEQMINSTGYTAPKPEYYLNNYSQFNSYPTTMANTTILSYTYYDNYTQLSGFSFDPSKVPAPPTNDNTIVPSINSNSVKGLVTGTKLRIMDPENPSGNDWITTVNYYDAKGRMIQSQQNNLKGGTEINSNLYFFQGMAYENVNYHQNPDAKIIPGANAALTSIKLDKKYKRNLGFGGNDQVWNIQQSINDGTAYNIAYYDYNHLGQPVVKQYTIANVLQEYNIRGWLKHILARSPTNRDENYFNETLHYDEGFSSKLYNGNIAGITWTYYNADDNTQKHTYGYSYDKLNRLSHAEYRNNYANLNSWVKDNYDYTNSNISYDDLGNIQTMNHRGNIAGAPGDMDILSYTYAPNSNKLIKVSDAVAPATTSALPDFKDNANLTEEYTYDDNGNLLTDANKDITEITYNYLNKPEQITVNGKGTITYVYDAAGNRLRKKIKDLQAGTDETWDYIGNFVYKNDQLQYIINEEGRSRPQGVTSGSQIGQTKFVYDYFIKDHLGNVRSTISAETDSAQYLAGHEIATANAEQLIFDNIAAVREDKPGSINPDDVKAAKLIASNPNKRIGTAIMLRVMPGDKLTFGTDAYYESEPDPNVDNSSAEDIVTSLTAALTGGTVGGMPVSESGNSSNLINQALGNAGLGNQLENILNQTYTGNGPKAGLNYLFFDRNMKLVSGLSGSLPVTATPGVFNNISHTPVVSTEPGYVIVYVDNRNIGTDVWFDNVQVSHYSGQILEEDHYYPFGLTLAQTSAGGTPQPYKYNGKELEKSFGLELYDYGARMFNPQLGRWNGVDPHADKYNYETPFNYAGNNPVKNIDIGGKFKFNYNEADMTKYGLTKADMVRFETVINNSYNLIKDNPQALELLSNNTGFSQERIKYDMTPDQGPDIKIDDDMNFGARGGPDGIKFDPDVIKNLASIDPNDKSTLNDQAYGLGIVVLHEYTHHGDNLTNGGQYTGEWVIGKDNKTTHQVKGGFSDKLKPGKQKWITSPFGHRGKEIERLGFGVELSVDPVSGEINYRKIDQSVKAKGMEPPKQEDLPASSQKANALKTLDIK